ncbi:MAG: glycerol-3-phosphate acyltransferase [Olsenella profusa]
METSTLITVVGSLALGYACGNFLTADLVARGYAHRPVFELGDGNPGMANVGHELGMRAAALVLVGDILKTVVAWATARALLSETPGLAGVIAGLGVTLGHNYPCWRRFRGGKGVTTTCSAIILATPLAGMVASLVGLAVVLFSGYLCLGAVAITWAYWILTALLRGPVSIESVVALVLTLLMMRAHWPALAGIRAGTTHKARLARALRSRLGIRGHTRR